MSEASLSSPSCPDSRRTARDREFSPLTRWIALISLTIPPRCQAPGLTWLDKT